MGCAVCCAVAVVCGMCRALGMVCRAFPLAPAAGRLQRLPQLLARPTGRQIFLHQRQEMRRRPERELLDEHVQPLVRAPRPVPFGMSLTWLHV